MIRYNEVNKNGFPMISVFSEYMPKINIECNKCIYV